MSVSSDQRLDFFDAYCGVGISQQPQEDWAIDPAKLLEAMDHYGIGKALVYPNFIRELGSPAHGAELLAEYCRISSRFEPLIPLYPHPYPDLPSIDAQLDKAREIKARAVWCNATNMLG